MRLTRLPFTERPRAAFVVLVFATAALAYAFDVIQIPAALLLGSLLAGLIVAGNDGGLAVPRPIFTSAIGMIACLIASRIEFGMVPIMIAQWPFFLFGVVSVVFCSAILGAAVSRMRLLPGTTAVWGSAPGAATMMVMMADEFGDDVRLVGSMQFIRVILVAITAAIAARCLGTTPATAVPHLQPDSTAAIISGPIVTTFVIGVGGALLGDRVRIPNGWLLVPLISATLLSAAGMIVIVVPQWLMMIAYVLLGWTIGLRFTRDTIIYAYELLPRIIAFTLALILVCGGLAFFVHLLLGADLLTAYLAMSPGGIDAVAVIAASTNADMAPIMAMHIARLFVIIAIGPFLARRIARWIGRAGKG